MKKCDKCGSEVSDNDSNCSTCGDKIIKFSHQYGLKLPQHTHLSAYPAGYTPKTELPFVSPDQENLSHLQDTFLRTNVRVWLIILCVLLLIISSTTGIVFAASQAYNPQQGRAVPHKQVNHMSTTKLIPIVTATPIPSPTVAPTPVPTATATPIPSPAVAPTPVPTATATPIPSPTVAPIQLLLSSPREIQSQTIATTGTATIPGKQATGTVSIDNNYQHTGLSFAKGTIFKDEYCKPSSLEIALDTSVALNPGGKTSISVHELKVGESGNAPYQCIDGDPDHFSFFWTSRDNNIQIRNEGSFTGGVNPKVVSVVQQNDINTLRTLLTLSTTKAAKNDITTQLKLNEDAIGNPHCSSSGSSNPAVGVVATRVQVTVSTICTWSAVQYGGS